MRADTNDNNFWNTKDAYFSPRYNSSAVYVNIISLMCLLRNVFLFPAV